MKVLITGAPGWLGNRFLEVLIKGFDARGAVNDWPLRCLTVKGANLSFLQELSRIKNIECVGGDIRIESTLAEAVRGIDTVIHIAGLIHPGRIRQLYEINTLGTENLLRASIQAGVKRFVYVSSNSVAGTNPSRDLLMTEADPPKPYLNYGQSKFKAEVLVQQAFREGRLETVILRPCWYYGPNQPPRQTTFFKMIQKGNPIIFGSGNNLRSMSYVDNTCQALLLAAESDRAKGQTYWIADGRPYTTNEIYETVAKILNVKNYRPRHVPDFVSEGCLLADRMLQSLGCYIKEIHVAGEMNKNIACSIEKARRELGYDPKVSLEEGMRLSVDWCRKNGIPIE